MSEINQAQDEHTINQMPQNALPSMLNVLTILTLIGSGLNVITAFTLKFGCKVLEMEAFLDKMKEKEIEILQKTCDNYLVIMLIMLIGALLCIGGALMMRKLKKQGFVIYVVGELLPLVATPIIVGGSDFSDWKTWLGNAFAILFIGLYASQRKHLTL